MERIEEYLLAAENPIGKKQRRILFKRRRASKVLTREQVKAIKMGRKLIRKELKERGLKSKEDFELTATRMGLYFDKNRFLLWLRWLFHGRALWALLGALAVLMIALFAFSIITQMQGHFTINMSSGMFREGFVLSETADFKNPTTHLFCSPAENVPCISISHIPENIDAIDGQHNDNYFAYTFYIRNEGESTVGYNWSVRLNSESQNLSSACWVMVFEDGEMMLYAKANDSGETEALPPMEDNTQGYLDLPVRKFSRYPNEQFPLIAQKEGFAYYRTIPFNFESDTIVASGTVEDVEPMEVHKYTVVIWLEGDDPDCSDDLIGGHAGMDFNFKMITEEEEGNTGDGSSWSVHWDQLWENLLFWLD